MARHQLIRLDTDTPPPRRVAGTYADAVALRVTTEGVWVADGTEPVTCDLPPGTNYCLGTVVDGDTGRLLWFNWNSTSQHGIWSYDPQAGTAGELVRWSGFNLPANGLVTAAILNRTLIWIDRVNPARQLDLDNVAAVAAAPSDDLLSLARRPPLLPLAAVTSYDSTIAVNRLLDASLQFTYRYRYVDGQFSVLAPWSVLVEMRRFTTSGLPAGPYDNTITLTVPTGERPGAGVEAAEFYVRKGNDGTAYRLTTDDTPFPDTATAWTIITTYDSVNEALDSTAAASPFDNLPTGPPQALEVAKGRPFIANFSDGYELPTGLSLAVALVSQSTAQLEGKRVWRAGETVRLGLVAYDAFGRNSGVIPGTIQTVTIPDFDYSAVTPTCVTALTCTIAASVPLPAWVARVDVVRTDKADTPFFTQGVGRLVYEYPYARFITGRFDDQTFFSSFIFAGGYKKIWVDISSLTARERGYTYQSGDYITFATRNYMGGGATTVKVGPAPVLEQRGSLLRVELTAAQQRALLGNLPSGGGLPDVVVNYATTASDPDEVYTSIINTPTVSGFVFNLYTPSTLTQATYYEVAASVAVAPGQDAFAALTLTGDTWLAKLTTAAPLTYYPVFFQEASVDSPADVVVTLTDASLAQHNTLYWRWFFNTSPTDLYPDWNTDRGRPQAVLPERLRHVVNRPTAVRFGGKALPGTAINGLNTFDVASEKILPVEYGAITALVTASDTEADGSVLLALCRHEAVSLYVEAGVVQLAGGQTLGVTSDQVIPSTRVLAGGWGCQHPEGVARRGGRVYWPCAEKNELVRYAQNGAVPLGLSYRVQQFLRPMMEGLRGGGTCVAGVDGEWNEVAWTWETPIPGKPAKRRATLAFAEALADGQPGFTTRYPHFPERYGSLPYGLVSFASGRPLRHGAGTPATYDGRASEPAVTIVDAGTPGVPTVWRSATIEAANQWTPTALTNERGQTSRCFPAWLRQGPADVWRAEFRRDQRGDPANTNQLNHGAPLRSLTLRVTLTIVAPAAITPRGRLDAVTILGQPDVVPARQ